MQRITVVAIVAAALLGLLAAGRFGTAANAGHAVIGSPAANEALARRWFAEFANGGDLALADKLVTPAHVQHDTLVPADADGPAGQRRMIDALRTGFPDLRFAVEDVVADADSVVVRWTLTGTHAGEFSGVAPSGAAVTLPGTTMFHVERGKIAETWVTYDSHWLLLQIGNDVT